VGSKPVLQLWAFAHEMWEHQNSVLHNTPLEFLRRMRDANINNAIVKLYGKVEGYLADDRWYFDVPLAIRLCKLLRLRRQWLVNARILVDKSESRALIGQMMMNQYYPPLPSARTDRNASLGEQIGSAQKYIPGEKSQVAHHDVVLVYLVSAGAGNQAIILDKRSSVMPLKCFCFVNADLEFWCYCLEHMCSLQSVIAHRLRWRTLHELHYGDTPNISMI
jgi:hypothetical protein